MSYIKSLAALGLIFFSLPVIAAPFWKAEKDSQKFYILGTIHMGVSIKDIQCSKIVQDKIKKSDSLFVEDFNPDIKGISKDIQKKLLIGSKEEQERIQLSKGIKEHFKNRAHFLRLMVVYETLKYFTRQGIKLVEDEGQFKDLSEESQNFLIQTGLYDESKNYRDYLLDIMFMAQIEALFSQEKHLDTEVMRLALDHNIPIESLDENKNIISDLEKDIIDLSQKEGQDQKIDSKYLDQTITAYEQLKQAHLSNFSNMASQYKSMDWKVQRTDYFADADAIIKNRNEAWLEKMLLNKDANQDQSIFMAVGYSHLTESDSVLTLLEEEGFKVTLIDKKSCQF